MSSPSGTVRCSPGRCLACRADFEYRDYLEWRSGSYAHQGDAVEGWEQGEPPERGVVAMGNGRRENSDGLDLR